MKKSKIIAVDFQARKNQPAAGRWFPEDSLTRLEPILAEDSEPERIEQVEDRKVELVEG